MMMVCYLFSIYELQRMWFGLRKMVGTEAPPPPPPPLMYIHVYPVTSDHCNFFLFFFIVYSCITLLRPTTSMGFALTFCFLCLIIIVYGPSNVFIYYTIFKGPCSNYYNTKMTLIAKSNCLI